MNKYICTKTYSIQEYDSSGNKTETVVVVGLIMEEGNKYLDKRYCRLIPPKKIKNKQHGLFNCLSEAQREQS